MFDRNQCVVLGAGIGGLLAAGVAARFFDRVVVVEKDTLTDELRPRKGVPQGPQVHAIIKRGENAIASIFPEFPDRMRRAGGAIVTVGQDVRYFEGGGWHPQRTIGFEMFTQTRALLEREVRHCLAALSNVTIRDGARFAGYAVADGRVTGVTLQSGETIPADAAVDAMGRGSPTPKWLADNGHGAVRRSVTGINVHYVTMLLRRPRGYEDKASGWVIRPTAPDHVHGATMLSVEDNQWLLTLVSRFGDAPPLDFPGVLDFAKTVEGDFLYDVIKDTNLTAAPRRFNIPEAILSHFDELPDLPAGLLPLGDVVGNFNPVFAQGMTIASLHAETLREKLTGAVETGQSLAGFSNAYIKAAVALSRTAWQGAANMDFAYPQTVGDRPPDLEEIYATRRALRHAMETDAELHRDMVKVQHMLLPPEVLAGRVGICSDNHINHK